MTAWLAAHFDLVIIFFAALNGGWIGLNRRRDRKLEECRVLCKGQAKKIRMLQRDYTQVLEFNFQDRYTIRELAIMVSDFRKELNLPPEDILLVLGAKAEREMKARQLSAQRESGIHRTFQGGDDSLTPEGDL
jgi:hypothetical protein